MHHEESHMTKQQTTSNAAGTSSYRHPIFRLPGHNTDEASLASVLERGAEMLGANGPAPTGSQVPHAAAMWLRTLCPAASVLGLSLGWNADEQDVERASLVILEMAAVGNSTSGASELIAPDPGRLIAAMAGQPVSGAASLAAARSEQPSKLQRQGDQVSIELPEYDGTNFSRKVILQPQGAFESALQHQGAELVFDLWKHALIHTCPLEVERELLAWARSVPSDKNILGTPADQMLALVASI